MVKLSAQLAHSAAGRHCTEQFGEIIFRRSVDRVNRGQVDKVAVRAREVEDVVGEFDIARAVTLFEYECVRACAAIDSVIVRLAEQHVVTVTAAHDVVTGAVEGRGVANWRDCRHKMG